MFSNSIHVMSMVMRLPNTYEILISLFPVLIRAQESGNAQAHYNMRSLCLIESSIKAHDFDMLYHARLILRILLLVEFSLFGLLISFLLQHPANEEHTHDHDVKNADWHPHNKPTQLLICGW